MHEGTKLMAISLNIGRIYIHTYVALMKTKYRIKKKKEDGEIMLLIKFHGFISGNVYEIVSEMRY